MKNSLLLAGCTSIALTAAWIGCATTGTSNHGTGGSGGGTTKTTSSSGSTGSSGGTGGAGGADAGDAGGGDGGLYHIHCNPVTNAGCKSGSACDYSTDSAGNVIGFRCYINQTPAPLCGSCDTVSCGGDTTCFYVDQTQTTAACARYCCSDTDCGSGTCQFDDGATPPTLLFAPAAPTLGVCVASATVDAGPDAGAAGVFSCDAPATAPSMGSCVTLGP
jgi:hypothetical protein